MWMGELITQRGIGKRHVADHFLLGGVRSPSVGASLRASNGWFAVALVAVVAAILLVFIIYIENGTRKIPVQFAKRQVGRRMYGGQSTYIPLKVNQAGVIPIIFASAFLQMPVLLVNVLPQTDWGNAIRKWINDNLVAAASPIYLGIFGLLIFAFSYSYTSIAFDPVQQADQLRKQGGFIPASGQARRPSVTWPRCSTGLPSRAPCSSRSCARPNHHHHHDRGQGQLGIAFFDRWSIAPDRRVWPSN